MTHETKQLPLVFTASDYVSVAWAGRALQCSKDTVYRLMEEGTLIAHRMSRNGWWRIRKDSVIAYMAQIKEMEEQG